MAADAIDDGLLVAAAAEAGVMPLAISRQFVTILGVRPCDLFAVFIQLVNELNSFLVNTLELGVAVAAEEGEEEEPPPRVVIPLVWPVLPPLPFFGVANAV
jgi:hypothetical protein